MKRPLALPTPEPQRFAAALAYALPLAAPWVCPDPSVAIALSLVLPLVLAVAGAATRRPALLFHGIQAFHLVAAFAVAAAFLGVVETPGHVRWAGALGSIPLDPEAGAASRVAFWVVAAVRAGALGILTLRTLRGLDPVLPLLGDVPWPKRTTSEPATGRRD